MIARRQRGRLIPFCPRGLPPQGDSRDNSMDLRAYGVASRGDNLGRAEGGLVSLDFNDT